MSLNATGLRRRVGSLLVLLLGCAAATRAEEKGSHDVSPFLCSWSTRIAIDVPGFHGLSPSLALGYTSEGKAGFAGVGWSLSGFSVIERTNTGRGSPRWDGTDAFTLDGQELLPCAQGSVSPSCTSGGQYTTLNESYLRIQYDSGANSWALTAKDGTRTTFTPLTQVTHGTMRWGQSSVVDTKGNTVTYNWAVIDGDTYPDSVTYNAVTVTLYREPRPDVLSYANWSSVPETRYRLRSIIVSLAGQGNVRAYALQYTTSATTGRSLPTSVQTYGRDAVVDASGLITGGTSLPAQTFSYANDALGQVFNSLSQGIGPPSPPGTTEPVSWVRNVNTTDSGSTVWKNAGTDGVTDASASSTRGIVSGDGYIQWTASQHQTWAKGGKLKGGGLSNADWVMAPPTTIQFSFAEVPGSQLWIYESGAYRGAWTRTSNDVLKIEISGGVVRYLKNSQVLYTSSVAPSYPLVAHAAIESMNGQILNASVSGALMTVAEWCAGTFATGDFSGDGRTDQLCVSQGTQVQVARATGTGFAAPSLWLNAANAFENLLVGDYNGDGITDVAFRGGFTGQFFVALSTGTAFQPLAIWGTASGWDGPYPRDCRINPAVEGAGDFNGDGLTDVSCRYVGSAFNGAVLIGLSTGTSFSFSRFATICSVDDEQGTMDLDGDAKDDWFCNGDRAWGHTFEVYRSNGILFGDPQGGWGQAQLGSSFCGGDYVLEDLNGDGRTDASCISGGKVALSTGDGFVEKGPFGGWCTWGKVFAADVDGDGTSELVCNNLNAPANDIEVRKWDGTTLTAAQTRKAAFCDATVTPGDYDGDARTDLYCGANSAVAVPGTTGIQADLMSSTTNGLGGTTSVTWVSSTAFSNVNNKHPHWAISSVTTNDGRGGSSTSTYTYAGAHTDAVERRFRGFGYAKRTLPCLSNETACPYVETWLNQDGPTAGRPWLIEKRDGQGRLLTAQGFEYTTNGTTIPKTSFLTGVWSYTYDGSGAACSTWPCASGKRTYTTQQHDVYGNRTQTAQYGEYDVSGDETTTTADFVPNASAYIVNRVAKTVTYADIGTGGAKLSEQLFYYDNAGTWNQAPTQGYVTNALAWLDRESRYVSKAFGYDGYGNQNAATDEAGRTVTTAYDLTYHVFPTSVTNAAGETATTTWDPVCGVPTSVTDANGQVTATQADPLCRTTRTDFPLGGYEIRQYLSLGSPVAQAVQVETPPATGSESNYTVTYFDGLGRTYRTAKKGPSPSQTILADVEYNSRGGVEWQTAPFYSGDTPRTTSFTYDALDRVTRTDLPDGNYVTNSYGLWNTTAYDVHGHAATTRFDAHGHAVEKQQTFQGNPFVTQTSYDLLGRLTGLTDPNGNVWSWSFDSLGRNFSKTDPDAGTWAFAFDDAGRQTSVTDAKNQTTSFTYDLAGRLATKSNASGTVTMAYGEARPGYFNVGRVTTVTSPNDTLRTDYDALGRAVKQTRSFQGVDYVVERRYDAGGYLQGMTYPDGDAVGTPANPVTYDAAGRLLTMPGIITGVSYDAAGRPLVQTNANGTTTTRSYSAERGFLTGIYTASGGGVIQDLVYTPDAAGMLEQVTSPFPNESWSYGYDELHRMITATNVGTPAESQSLQYDALGRIIYNSRVGSYTYAPDGTARPHAPQTAGSNTYAYDPNGNLYSGAGRSLTWDANNRIAQVTAGSVTTTFTYDADGGRLKKASGSSTSIYPMGDDYEITGGVVTKYVSAGGLGVVAKRVGSTTYWLHTDRLGSIQAITDATTTLVQRTTYRPHGDKIADATGHTESRGWIDQRNDGETGLTYLHARYYDPGAGVFLSPDPLAPASGLNAYAYSSGDPINASDRTGLAEVVTDGVAKAMQGGLAGNLSSESGFNQWLAWVGAQTFSVSNPDAAAAMLSNMWLSMNDQISGAWQAQEVIWAREKAKTEAARKAAANIKTTVTTEESICTTPECIAKAKMGPDNEVAVKTLQKNNPRSVQTDSEVCFEVCKRGNRYFTSPLTWGPVGGDCRVEQGCPAGSTFVGDAHSHGRWGNWEFSGKDLMGWQNPDFPKRWMINPVGGVLMFDPSIPGGFYDKYKWLVPNPSPSPEPRP